MNKSLVLISILFISFCSTILIAAKADAKRTLLEWRNNFLSRIKNGESSKSLEIHFQDQIDNMKTLLIEYHYGKLNKEEAIAHIHSCMRNAFDRGLEKVPVELNNLIRNLASHGDNEKQSMSIEQRDVWAREIHSNFQTISNDILKEKAIKLIELWETQRYEKTAALFLNNTGETVSGYFEVFESMVDALYALFEEEL